jgi:predicted MFS family arabinose efflux permease
MEQTTNRRNYWAFIWHASWLALTVTFTEVNTVLPGLIVTAGGTKIHVGILTAIMVGVPMLAQLIFAGYLTPRIYKKPFLLAGINFRVLALLGIAWTLWRFTSTGSSSIIPLVYLWMLIFATSGAFAGISYTDILGKSVEGEQRKQFMVLRQTLASIGVLISALIARYVLKATSYPDNYALLFVLAAACLFIASWGFWAIRERPTNIVLERGGLLDIFKFIPRYLKEDPNLRNYVIFNNLAGFAVTLMPFYIVLANESYGLSGEGVGNFLLISIIGLILSNIIWSQVVKRWSFRGVLIAWAILGGLLPILALILVATASLKLYMLVFFLGGASISAQRIAQEGVLLEISTEQTRTLYTGINGAFNLSIALFPLISGILITWLGYWPIFGLGSVAMLLAIFFARRLSCVVPA